MRGRVVRVVEGAAARATTKTTTTIEEIVVEVSSSSFGLSYSKTSRIAHPFLTAKSMSERNSTCFVRRVVSEYMLKH